MYTPEEIHQMFLDAQRRQRERDAELQSSKQQIVADRIEQEKKRRQQIEDEQRRKKAESEAEWAVIRASQALARKRGNRQLLEMYCSDVRDPQTRRELIQAIEATREAFLEE